MQLYAEVKCSRCRKPGNVIRPNHCRSGWSFRWHSCGGTQFSLIHKTARWSPIKVLEEA